MLFEQDGERHLLLIASSTRTRTANLYLEVQQDPREVTSVVLPRFNAVKQDCLAEGAHIGNMAMPGGNPERKMADAGVRVRHTPCPTHLFHNKIPIPSTRKTCRLESLDNWRLQISSARRGANEPLNIKPSHYITCVNRTLRRAQAGRKGSFILCCGGLAWLWDAC